MSEHRRFLASYPRFRFGLYKCVYCGEDAEGRDHVLPIVFLTSSEREKYRDRLGPQALCCFDCNSRLGDRMFDSFEERAAYIRARLAEKAKVWQPHWYSNEIAALDHGLQTFVRFKQAQRNVFRERADWFGTIQYYLNLEDLLYEPMLTRDHPKFKQAYYDLFASTIQHVTRSVYSRPSRSWDT